MKDHFWKTMATGFCLATMAMPLQAQQAGTDTAGQEAEELVLEEIIVTGSRIFGTNIDTAIPTQVLDEVEIEASGYIDIGEIANQLPGVYLGISPNSSLLSTQNAGLSTISLRALGTNRTLTLINGRRVVSNSGSAQRVDTGTIPSAFVSRIDITTGGASAAYGSDAIAGVANIVLLDSFDGFEVDTRYGEATEGGDEIWSVDATWGMNFGDDRGNVMLGFMYDDRGSVFASEREYAESNLEIDIGTGELEVNKSSYLPGGRFEVGDAWNNEDGTWQNDVEGSEYCIDDGRVPPCDDWQMELDGYDFRPYSMVSPERERLAAMGKVKWDFSQDITGWALFQYVEIDTLAQRAAAISQDAHTFGPFDDQTRIGDIAADHPFIHPAVEETRSGTVDWRRRFNEVGQRFRASNRETQRYQFGLDGNFNADWSWSAYAGYGTHEQNQIRENELNRKKIKFALDIEEVPGSPGSYRCVDEEARADGCVPLDVFGVGAISSEAADYVRATDVLYQKLKQTTASFAVTGSLFEMPAGTLLTAMGIDYRKEEQNTIGDPDTNAGLTTTGFIPDIQGEFDVTEAFIEINAPLLADRKGVHALDLTAAYRYGDYSTIGGVNSWNLGLSYAPTESVRFRTQISQAQRAPDITELFSSPRSDFDDVNDPCHNTTAETTGVVADNCRTHPGISAIIATEGVWEQDGSSIFGPNTGNPDLKEETGTTFTIGAVWTPVQLPGFAFIIDYYDIQVEDVISSVDSQLAADLCYNDPLFPDNKFCDSITRDIDGQIERIINQVENLNELLAEGIDVTIDYNFEWAGDWDVKFIYTHILTHEERFDGPFGEEVDTFVGEIGLPEDEFRFTLAWAPVNDVYLRYRAQYKGEAVDNLRVEPTEPGYLKVDSWVSHDIYASYTFGDRHRFRLYGGVNNLTDDHGPYLPDGYKHGSNSNVHYSYDPIGRRWYLGVKYMF